LVNTMQDETTPLREAMIAQLEAMDGIRSGPVAAAFRTVPRHLFAPTVAPEDAYAANQPVWPKHDPAGVMTSTVSAAHIQAVQLEQAQVLPGMRMLEIGSGGYNAALLAELVGHDGEVTTIDIDPEIIDRARGCLDSSGYHQVRTLVADADAGLAEFAPYDRIVVTVRAWDLPPAWIDQLAPGGRIVVPLRMRGLTRTVALDRPTDPHDPALLRGQDVRLCSFVPMQGAGAHTEPGFSVDGGRVQVRLDTAPSSDIAARLGKLAEATAEALRGPRVTLWSGVEFDHVDQLDLWLATFVPGFAVLAAEQAVVDEGLLTGAVRAGAPASVTAGGFAYRTKRSMPEQPGRFETGVLAWGPAAEEVGATYLAVIQAWGRHREQGGTGPEITVHPAGASVDGGPDRTVIDKSHTRLVLAWP
jgi:protein-L-isoaspartate(D-aspartate) O-methyltransferase